MKKTRFIYTALAILAGWLGTHHFYAGRIKTGIAQFCIFMIFILPAFFSFGGTHFFYMILAMTAMAGSSLWILYDLIRFRMDGEAPLDRRLFFVIFMLMTGALLFWLVLIRSGMPKDEQIRMIGKNLQMYAAENNGHFPQLAYTGEFIYLGARSGEPEFRHVPLLMEPLGTRPNHVKFFFVDGTVIDHPTAAKNYTELFLELEKGFKYGAEPAAFLARSGAWLDRQGRNDN